MRAIGLTEFGGPEVLQVLNLPDPVPGPGEVRIRVHAAAVNPTDTMLRAGGSATMLDDRGGSYVPGMDAAGVVDAIGPDTDTPLRPGDAVSAILNHYGPLGGGYAELVVAPAGSVVPVPDGADFPHAATLLMNALTARLALDALALTRGDTIAVTGAAGACGGYVVQLAKSDGMRVIADASERDSRMVADLGADYVVPRGDDVADRIRAVVPGGVDALVDGSAQHARTLPAIRDGGGLAVVRRWAGPTERDIQLHNILVTRAIDDQARLLRLRDQASKGELTLRVADVLPASQAAEAHRRLAAGGARGRLILDLTDF